MKQKKNIKKAQAAYNYCIAIKRTQFVAVRKLAGPYLGP